jgi:hypothetical protein
VLIRNNLVPIPADGLYPNLGAIIKLQCFSSFHVRHFYEAPFPVVVEEQRVILPLDREKFARRAILQTVLRLSRLLPPDRVSSLIVNTSRRPTASFGNDFGALFRVVV